MIGTILRGALDALDQSWTVRALERVNATLAAEVTHLRAQRDELQRENSRFQQEARDAREQLRKARAEANAKASLDRIFEENRPLFAALAKSDEPKLAWKQAEQWYLNGHDGTRLGAFSRDISGKCTGVACVPYPMPSSVTATTAIECVHEILRRLNEAGLLDNEDVDMSVIPKDEPAAAVDAPPVVDRALEDARLDAYRRHFAMTDNEAIALAVAGKAPTDPDFATWLVLLGRGDLVGCAAQDSSKQADSEAAYVARWRWEGASKRWLLVTYSAPPSTLAWMYRPDTTRDSYLAQTSGFDGNVFKRDTAIECAISVEMYLRDRGLPPTGPIDHSVFDEVTP